MATLSAGRARDLEPVRLCSEEAGEGRRVGRYVLRSAIARGGMATVHAARFIAAEGVTRLVAAKRLHPQYVDDPEFVAMFHDEARIASRIHHPNVVPVLDVVQDDDEVILVQEYVHGVPLSQLFHLAISGESEPIPIPIAVAIIVGVLQGLHGAHETTDELGEPLAIVHRDVSPQNVIVSIEGMPRLVDFGIAKARTSGCQTQKGVFKGKLAYSAPEQIRSEPPTRLVDVYAAGTMLWELVVNRRFYDGRNDLEFVRAVLSSATPLMTQVLEAERAALPRARWEDVVRLDPIVARALSADLAERYPTALAMADALTGAVKPATSSEVAAWVWSAGAAFLARRRQLLLEDEARSRAAIDENARPSGPRLRTDLAASCEDETLAEGVMLGRAASASIADDEASDRALVPWVFAAALLLVVGVLSAIITTRERAPTVPPGGAPPAPHAHAGVPATVSVPLVRPRERR